MPRHRYPWTEAAEIQIVSAVRGGAFPFIAAESVGIPREVFAEWMRRGSAKHASARFRNFRDKVRKAIALARLSAETYALKHDPLFWLKYGPGKETADIPGWSNAVKPPTTEDAGNEEQIPLSLLSCLTPEMGKLTPEMRAAIVATLQPSR